MTAPGPSRVDRLLAGRGTLGRLAARAARLAPLEEAVRACLDEPLSRHARVANVDGDTLVLVADSPAWASRLRFAEPTLVERLASRPGGWKIGAVRVITRPATEPPSSPPPRRPGLSATSATLLESVADSMDPGPLGRILRRLARHGRASRPGCSGSGSGGR